jgi:hypothetical protein
MERMYELMGSTSKAQSRDVMFSQRKEAPAMPFDQIPTATDADACDMRRCPALSVAAHSWIRQEPSLLLN